jgi:hypothetical protein
MKILKVIGLLLLSLVVLAVLLYLVGVAVNWRDRPPSAAAIEIKASLNNRAPVADSDNGFVYAMGFSVPAAADPQANGARRAAWLEAAKQDPTLLNADPVKEEVEFRNQSSSAMNELRKTCGDEHSAECRDAFLQAQAQPRNELEDLQRVRYRELLKRSAWREVVSTELTLPIARFGDIIEGQRLMFVDLAARTTSMPAGEIASELLDDLRFWRETLKSADYLITKMIAVAAIRQHFFFGNLVLRGSPEAQARVIEAWSVPFAAEELSMRRAMVGEIVFVEGAMLKWHKGAAQPWLVEPGAEGLTLMGRIGSSLARPYYQHQDQVNYYAASYLDFARRFDAPLGQYLQIAADADATAPDDLSFHVYNAVGHVFRGLSGTWDFSEYPVRVGSIEGMRRAALLTVQLRIRGVPPESIAEELKSSALRDPFDHEAFEWSSAEKAVVYEGPDAERTRYRHPYFY